MTAAGGLPACSSSGEGDEASAEPTPWQQELANLAPDGSRSLDSALRLFAMAFGPVPGVPSQPRPQEFIDATPAVREIEAREAELTPEQRDAVETTLRLPADARTVEISPEGQVSSSTEAEAGGGSRARRAAAFVGATLGSGHRVVLEDGFCPRPHRVRRQPRAGTSRGPIHPADRAIAVGGNLRVHLVEVRQSGLAACDVRLDPNIVSAAQAANTMIHEVVPASRTRSSLTSIGDHGATSRREWAWEGSSEWIAATMVGPFADTPVFVGSVPAVARHVVVLTHR